MTDKIREIRNSYDDELLESVLVRLELGQPVFSKEYFNLKAGISALRLLLTELDAAKEYWFQYLLQERDLFNGQKEHLRQQLDAAKQENELTKELYECERAMNDTIGVERELWAKERKSLQQQLKQAIEALEFIATTTQQNVNVRTQHFIDMARNTLFLIREEVGNGPKAIDSTEAPSEAAAEGGIP